MNAWKAAGYEVVEAEPTPDPAMKKKKS